MNYLTNMQIKRATVGTSVFIALILCVFGAPNKIVYAQYDYSAPTYDSSYSAPSYYSDYSAPSYYSDYSAPSYTSDYSAPSYTYDYSAPSYTSDYFAPSYSSDYSAPSYTSDYYAPSYTSDYSAPSYNYDYSAPSYTTTYGSYSSNYVTPTYSAGYSSYVPSYSYGGSSYSYYSPGTSGVYVPAPQPQNQINTLSGSCVANPTNANVGATVTWSISGVSGGVGDYKYSWTGTDGLSGSGISISKIYNVAGTKSATVTIESGSQSIVRNCYSYVNTPYVPPVIPPSTSPTYNMTAYCSAGAGTSYTGNTITWSATVSGGNGSYTYSWTGTDGLSGNSSYAYLSYVTAGTKFAYLTVSSSNGQSVNASCSTYVNTPYTYTPPPVITYSNPQPPVYYSTYQPYNYQSYNYQPYTYSSYTPPATYYQPSYNGAGVSLSQVPYTGFTSNRNIVLFVMTLLIWSAIATYVVVIRKKAHNKLALVENKAENKSPLFIERTGAGVFWPRLGGGAGV